MTFPSWLQALVADFRPEDLLVVFMAAVSLLLVAIAAERLLSMLVVFRSVRRARQVVAVARADGVAAAVDVAASLPGPAGPVLRAGLDRSVGRVRGDPERAMHRELKRLAGAMKARTWLLGTAGALMPFVGLFGTVIGVMASFQAIGESGQGGFAIVSVGISQALVATAVGIAVALEGVVLFNLLQNMAARLGRELSMQVDELIEVIDFERRAHAQASER